MGGPFMPSAAIWQVSNHTPPYIPSSRSKLAKSVITKKDNEATKWSLICLNSPIIQSKKIKLVTFVHWSHLVEKSFSRFLKVPTTGWQGHTRRTLNISDELTCFKKHSKPPHQCPCLVAASTFLRTQGAERCVVEIKLMPLIGSKYPMLGASIDVRPVLGCCLVYRETLLILEEANIINQSRRIVAIREWSLTCRATTASWGSSGSGAARRACINRIDICQYMLYAERWMTIYLTWTLRRTVRRVMAAAHWSFRMSRQIAPVTLDTFGCQILVINRTWTNARRRRWMRIMSPPWEG